MLITHIYLKISRKSTGSLVATLRDVKSFVFISASAGSKRPPSCFPGGRDARKPGATRLAIPLDLLKLEAWPEPILDAKVLSPAEVYLPQVTSLAGAGQHVESPTVNCG